MGKKTAKKTMPKKLAQQAAIAISKKASKPKKKGM